jgi:type 1 glutamine amidotransferase
MDTYKFLLICLTSLCVLTVTSSHANEPAKTRKLVLIAGEPSHPPMMHEFKAGSMLLEKRLKEIPGLIVDRHEMGWVKDEKTFDDAAAVVIYSDGQERHPVSKANHQAIIQKLIDRGVGFGCMHYAVETTKGSKEAVAFKDWLGGTYEKEFSCNPMWEPKYNTFPDHPVCRGVKPFTVKDEWYFNMRFVNGFNADGSHEHEGMKFTPILVDKPTMKTRNGPYVYPIGPYSHIQADSGRNETMLWVVERKDGGRGFGFTGGHFHVNWQDDNYRKVVVNSLCWVTGLDIPENGFDTAPVSDTELLENLDLKAKKK